MLSTPSRRNTNRQPTKMLFAGDDLADLRARWAGVQAAFVDDPKDCVQKADAPGFRSGRAAHDRIRRRHGHIWKNSGREAQEASTEDLRMALMHYREFFDRLLAV